MVNPRLREHLQALQALQSAEEHLVPKGRRGRSFTLTRLRAAYQRVDALNISDKIAAHYARKARAKRHSS